MLTYLWLAKSLYCNSRHVVNINALFMFVFRSVNFTNTHAHMHVCVSISVVEPMPVYYAMEVRSGARYSSALNSVPPLFPHSPSCILDTTNPHMPDLGTDCRGQAASTPLSQLGGSGFRPQLTDMLPWFSQFSIVHLGNCQENTSNHTLPILSNSLFIYSLSLHDSLRYQLHC